MLSLSKYRCHKIKDFEFLISSKSDKAKGKTISPNSYKTEVLRVMAQMVKHRTPDLDNLGYNLTTRFLSLSFSIKIIDNMYVALK